jgi:hypothetical protein
MKKSEVRDRLGITKGQFLRFFTKDLVNRAIPSFGYAAFKKARKLPTWVAQRCLDLYTVGEDIALPVLDAIYMQSETKEKVVVTYVNKAKYCVELKVLDNFGMLTMESYSVSYKVLHYEYHLVN